MKKSDIKKILNEYENTEELEEFIKMILNTSSKIFRDNGQTFVEINYIKYVGSDDKKKLAEEFIKENDLFENLKKLCTLINIKLNLEDSGFDLKMEKNKLNKTIWYEEYNYRLILPLSVYSNIINNIFELKEKQEKTLKYTV